MLCGTITNIAIFEEDLFLDLLEALSRRKRKIVLSIWIFCIITKFVYNVSALALITTDNVTLIESRLNIT